MGWKGWGGSMIPFHHHKRTREWTKTAPAPQIHRAPAAKGTAPHHWIRSRTIPCKHPQKVVRCPRPGGGQGAVMPSAPPSVPGGARRSCADASVTLLARRRVAILGTRILHARRRRGRSGFPVSCGVVRRPQVPAALRVAGALGAELEARTLAALRRRKQATATRARRAALVGRGERGVCLGSLPLVQSRPNRIEIDTKRHQTTAFESEKVVAPATNAWTQQKGTHEGSFRAQKRSCGPGFCGQGCRRLERGSSSPRKPMKEAPTTATVDPPLELWTVLRRDEVGLSNLDFNHKGDSNKVFGVAIETKNAPGTSTDFGWRAAADSLEGKERLDPMAPSTLIYVE